MRKPILKTFKLWRRNRLNSIKDDTAWDAVQKRPDSKKIIPSADILALKNRLVAQVRERIVRKKQLLGANTSLPTSTPGFVGRKQELKDLELVLSRNRTICVRGPAGIGKSELVVRALSKIDDNRETLWLDISAFNDVKDVEISCSAPWASIPNIPL